LNTSKGDVYEGFWLNDYYSGWGDLTKSDGTIVRGVWGKGAIAKDLHQTLVDNL